MVKSSELIWHDGKIIEVSGDSVKVVIESSSACSLCHNKKECPVSEIEHKVVEIKNVAQDFSLGDEVLVYFEKSVGFRALLLGYLIPFAILFVVLMLSFGLTGNELLSGIFAVSTLIPYYFGVYLFRNKIKKSFAFKISKKNI